MKDAKAEEMSPIAKENQEPGFTAISDKGSPQSKKTRKFASKVIPEPPSETYLRQATKKKPIFIGQEHSIPEEIDPSMDPADILSISQSKSFFN